MLTKEYIDDLLNKDGNILSADGDKIGSIGQIYADDENGRPTWVTARTGLFGTSESFIPLEGARLEGSGLSVGTEKQATGRARLRKYGTTENVTQTVPVQREEVRLEREPVTDANVNAATSGPAISDADHEVVLHEERAVVDKETVPVERVRLGTETVADEVTVDEQVRKERIEADGIDDTPRL